MNRTVLILLLSAAPAMCQMNTGEISGAVRDLTGATLPGAAVIAQQTATGQKFTTHANGSGEYLFSELPLGVFSLSASAPNFRPVSVSPIPVHAGDRLRRDFVLEVGEKSDIVTVVADPANPELESAEIRDVVGTQQVADLPVKDRQFLDLAMLSPGVVRPPGGTRGDALQQAGVLVNVLGQRSGHNLYLLDGVSITDEHFNNLVIAPSIDAIQEINVEKTSYAPEFGGKSGAVINVLSKSGTNDVHGSLFEFVRNNVFDAKNFFDSAARPIPPFRENQFGASVGGPIRKNRTFYFLSYEGERIRKSLTETFSVPTAAMRAGNFSGLAAVYNPDAPAGAARQPFAGNQIPTGLLDPAATALLAKIPLPNLPGIAQNLLSTGDQSIDQNHYSARIDHQISDSNTAYLRASIFDAREFDPFGSGVLQETLLPGFGRNLSTHTVNGVAGWTRTFTPNVVNEFRMGFLTVSGGQTSPNAGSDFAAQAGILGVTTNPADMGYPQVSFGGQFSTMGDPALFTFRNNHDYEFYDNLIWHHGRHTIKAGAYFMHFNLRTTNPNGARGIFSFTPQWTSSAPGLADGNAFANFLLGYPTTAQVGLGRGAMDGNTNWAQFYVQDSWQAAPNLKFEFGLRYEYNQNMTDAANQIAAIDTAVPGGRFVIASGASGQLASSAAALLAYIPIPYVSSAAAGWNDSLLAPRYFRLAPRAGLAWNIGGSPKTVFRAGAGIYPNQAAYSIVTNLAQNLPFFVTKTVNSSTTALVPSFTTENALAANTVGTVGGNNLDHDYQIEYNEVWNASVERDVSAGTVLSVSYVGSRTVHADSGTELNVPVPGPGAIAARRPIPQLAQIGDIRWNGWASYNALTLSAKRRFAKGLFFDANWTWSHSIDDASDPGATLNEANIPQNVYDLAAEKATSSFDHRQRLVLSSLYQIPMARSAPAWARALFGEWQAGGNFTAQSGAPFTVNISSDQANIGAGPAQRPNVSGNPNDGPKTPQEWFNTAVFSLPALYTFGNAPRNSVIGPGLEEFDISLQKDIPLHEALTLRFRGEAYNILNHPNFNIPNRIAQTANFGSISSAQDSRQLQFALKLLF
ncbi:MAG TPA: carboxypeptidase regulatory-like domain-containing protein [Bryobacteraceae bacterium]|nr:carboxypeptidase regulatory-like domain-containing protein [Bryobacteraceae bacterium]